MFATLRDKSGKGKSISGLLIFYDENHTFSEPHVPHIEILREQAQAVCIGAVSVPVVLFELPSDGSVKRHSGALARDNDACVFRSSKFREDLEVSIVSFQDPNRELFMMAVDRSRLPITIVSDANGARVERCTVENIYPGNSAVRNWVGCLAVNRAFITKTFFDLCSKGPSAFEAVFKQDAETESYTVTEARFWIMWYPTPQPESLKSWLQFLGKGKGYSIEDVMEFSPVNEGFYRFNLCRPRSYPPGQVIMEYDDNITGKDYTEIVATAVENPVNEKSLLLQVSVPLHFRVPGEKKKKEFWSRGFEGAGETIISYVLPDTDQVSSGRMGPFHSANSPIWARKVAKDNSAKAFRTALSTQAWTTLSNVPPFPNFAEKVVTEPGPRPLTTICKIKTPAPPGRGNKKESGKSRKQKSMGKLGKKNSGKRPASGTENEKIKKQRTEDKKVKNVTEGLEKKEGNKSRKKISKKADKKVAEKKVDKKNKKSGKKSSKKSDKKGDEDMKDETSESEGQSSDNDRSDENMSSVSEGGSVDQIVEKSESRETDEGEKSSDSENDRSGSDSEMKDAEHLEKI